MGTCLGRCFNIKNSKRMSYFHSFTKRKPSQEVILELTDDLVPRADDSPCLEIATSSIFSKKNVQYHGVSARPVAHPGVRERSDASNTPPSSLDLEWEHEGGPFATVPEEDPEKVSSSESCGDATPPGWSRITTPDSLEWDPVEAPLTAMPCAAADVDSETEMLLTKIEHLSSSALRETGDWRS